MASLYEIDQNVTAAISAVYSKIDAETGEILDASAIDDMQALEALQMERKQKLENIACYIKNLESDAAALKAEAKKLTDRAKSKESRAESLRKYIKSSMIAAGDTSIDTPRAALSFRSSKALYIPDESVIQPMYCTETIIYKPNKKAIKEAIEAGREVTGASIVINQNLQIK